LFRKPKVVAIANHPIQYQAPLFRKLTECGDVEFAVAFAELPDAAQQGQGFGVPFKWDIPLLEGYRWTVLPTRPVTGVGGRRRVLSPRIQVRELRADVLLLTGWQTLPLIQMLLAAVQERVPVLMRGESSALKRRNAIVRTFHRALLRRVDGLLVIGTANRAFYESYGVPRTRMFDAPYFVDNGRFGGDADAYRGQRRELRAQYAIPEDAACFVFAGKFEQKKHPEHLLKALALLQGRNPELLVHGLLVGAGALEGSLRDFARLHHLPVTFAGFLNQTEIAKAYVVSDALVLPSDYGETWGLVVNEAMACGLPALVSDRVGCGPDLVLPGVTGER
jgi:glycosyltransferase involved in cell wall biosynthesis